MNDTLSFAQPVAAIPSTDYHSPVIAEPAPEQVPAEITPPQAEVIPEIFAYVREVVPANNEANSPDIAFEIILQASSQGKSGTIVKKIKLCKQALFQELMNNYAQQGTFVEAKEQDKSELKRFRELAGISHPKNYV